MNCYFTVLIDLLHHGWQQPSCHIAASDGRVSLVWRLAGGAVAEISKFQVKSIKQTSQSKTELRCQNLPDKGKHPSTNWGHLILSILLLMLEHNYRLNILNAMQ